jgi:putative hydrolase of the HAD superfamily
VVFDWGDTLMRVLDFQGVMAHWPQVEMVPGADAALRQLNGRLVCCVASNAGDSDAELMGLALARVGLRGYFDYLWTSRELGASKPHPDFFRAVLDKLKLRPGECVMVGDDYDKDIVGARLVGMRTVWLAGASVAGPAPDADVVIGSLGELVGAIARIGGEE